MFVISGGYTGWGMERWRGSVCERGGVCVGGGGGNGEGVWGEGGGVGGEIWGGGE